MASASALSDAAVVSAGVGESEGFIDTLIQHPWYPITRPFMKAFATLAIVGIAAMSIPITLWMLDRTKKAAIKDGFWKAVAIITAIQRMKAPQEVRTIKTALWVTDAAARMSLFFKGLVAGGDEELSAPKSALKEVPQQNEREVEEVVLKIGPSPPKSVLKGVPPRMCSYRMTTSRRR